MEIILDLGDTKRDGCKWKVTIKGIKNYEINGWLSFGRTGTMILDIPDLKEIHKITLKESQ